MSEVLLVTGMSGAGRSTVSAALEDIGFEGLAVGGLAVGETVDERTRVLEGLMPHVPPGKPRYLMGVGRPQDILEAVRRGIDMFDCVMPTRSGRTGQCFTRRGTVNMRNARHAGDPRPLDNECACPACRECYSSHCTSSGM